jgi:hypothetical protein
MRSRPRARLAGCAALVACLTLSLAAATAESASTTLYVDAGSVGGQCSDARTASVVSSTTPLCTLTKAAQLVTDGGTILVRAGTYPKLTVDRAFAQRVTIKAFPGELPELRGAHLPITARNVRLEHFRVTDITETEGDHLELVDNDMSPSGIVLNGNDNLAQGNYIHDLRIVFDENSTAARCHSLWRLDGENDQNHDGQYDYPLSQTGGIAPRCGHAFRVKGTNNVIRGNFVMKVPADGVQATATSNLLVEGNHFEDIAVQSSADGGDPLEHTDGTQLLGENKNSVFRNNVYIDTRGLLAMLDKNNQWPTNLRVENNVFHTATKDTGRGIGCIHASAVTGMTIVNNTCWGAGDFDPRIRISDGTPTTSDISETTGVVLKNNIIERYVTEGTVGVTEDYNLIKRYEAVAGPGLGTHSSIGEPAFVADDPLLRLASGSAGIDAGTSDGAPGRDREGRLRCDEISVTNTGGGTQPYFDLGAHEFGSGGASCRPAYSDVVSASRPVSYWRAGEPSGIVAIDRMGANPGAYAGALALGQPGAVAGDTAVRLKGSGQIKVPDSASLDTGDAFTVEMWVKLAVLRTTMGLASKGSYLVYLDSAGYVNLRKPGVGAVTRSTAAISDTSAYHHVVVAKSGAAARIYIDGVNQTGTVTNRAIGNTTSALLLGNGSGYLNGTLDEVALYPRALAASEVADHYAAR